MLELKSISKDYIVADTTINALSNVNIAFRQTEFVAILGPSGCGKTTLLNIVGGLDRYTTGDLLINGRSTKEYGARDWDTYRNRRIGFIFQSYNLIGHLTVLANVELALTISGVSPKEKKARATHALLRVGLSDQLNKKPNQLSGGQMQRVAIARAIVNDPEIILADEPTGALDSVTSLSVLKILEELASERLVIMVTHNAELAQQFSTRTVTLLDGNVISDSDPFVAPQKTEEIASVDNAKNATSSAANTDTKSKNTPDHTFESNNDKVDISTESALNEPNSDDKPQIDVKAKKTKQRSSMSLWTALSLSARNLVTKKFRTTLTTIAGSIGIIGIALVLAISNGFSIFMNDLERTTLASFPLTVSALSFDLSSESYSANMYLDEEGSFPDEKVVIPSEPNDSFGAIDFHANYLTESYLSYVKKMESDHPEWFANISYTRTLKMHLLTNEGTATAPKYSKVDTTSLTATWWQELQSENFLLGEYDLLAGKFPTSSRELVLVVNNKNELSKSTLETLGYSPKISPETKEYLPYSFTDFIGENGEGGKSFKLILNNDYYQPNGTSESGIPLFKELDSKNFEKAYNDSEVELNIVGILRVKENANLALLYSGIGYLPSLTEEVLKSCADSDIVNAQKNTYIDVLSNGIDEFEFDFTAVDTYLAKMDFDISGLPDYYYHNFGFINEEGYNRLKSDAFNFGDLYDAIAENDALVGDESAPIDKMLLPLKDMVDLNMIKSFLNAEYAAQLKNIGADTVPTTISIYPSNFEYKDDIKKHLDDYNTLLASEVNHIKYTDLAATLSESVSEMVDISTYVLVAFAAISLIVSSIMIAIITYISVLERTKEIGVLRSLGARKIDVSNVFNAETLIIGCISGVLGVVVAAVLTIPINNLISSYAGPMVQNLAKLSPLHGILLVLLSMVLTLISGFIPATIASRKDPVVALRE